MVLAELLAASVLVELLPVLVALEVLEAHHSFFAEWAELVARAAAVHLWACRI